MPSVQFSRSAVPDSLQPHELQHSRPPCPSPTPRVHSDSHPESVMPSSHLILCLSLLLLPPIPPSIRVFSNESTLRMRWPKYCLREAQTRKVEVLQNSKDVQKLWYSQKNRKLPTVNHWRGIIFVLRNYCERQSYVLVHRWRVCLICDALPLVQLRIFLATCLMMYYNLLLPFASFSSTFKTICKSSLADTVNF